MDRFNRSVVGPMDLLAQGPGAGMSAGFETPNMAQPSPGINSPEYSGAISIVQEQLRQLLRAAYKYGKVMQKTFTVGTTPDVLLPEDQNRRYLFVINLSTANRLWLGFDSEPNSAAGVGVPIELNLGFYEPLYTPTNQIYVVGAGAGTQGICVWSSEA